ncbi:hypothetical protein [Streptomyces sp. NPDC002133]|uniref:hypothetical protein n=1 Tax=Streptomyces sp. NPDC002133 TaxID=3154409 RepID=UPI00331E7B7C
MVTGRRAASDLGLPGTDRVRISGGASARSPTVRASLLSGPSVFEEILDFLDGKGIKADCE